MFLRNIVKTFLSKFFVLLLNFALLVLTTNILGSQGRGMISIIMADLAIIAIFNNILGGNSAIYQIPRIGLSRLFLPAYLWIIVSSVLMAFLISIILTHNSFVILVILTILTSFVSFNLLVFIGKEKINLFNAFSLLLPALFLFFNLCLFYVLNIRTVNAYLCGYFLSQLIVFIISFIAIKPELKKHKLIISRPVIVATFAYGWKNELSYFLQFLNYRLAYFFILYFVNITSVGLYSVAIALAEAIWIINKSITTVQYSKIINLKNIRSAVLITKKSVKLSLFATILILLVVLIIPAHFFGLVFGKEFAIIKPFVLLLMPGILFMSVSNVYGHYFAATNQMNLLIIKSIIGLIVTVVFSLLMIPIWGIQGACIVTTLSHTSSSMYLIIRFHKKIRRSLQTSDIIS